MFSFSYFVGAISISKLAEVTFLSFMPNIGGKVVLSQSKHILGIPSKGKNKDV